MVECEAKCRAITERPPEKAFRRAQGVELRERRGRRRRRGAAEADQRNGDGGCTWTSRCVSLPFGMTSLQCFFSRS
jgi:hypothetical protein